MTGELARGRDDHHLRRGKVRHCPGLEKLDRVPVRILEQDLLAAGALDDLVAERRAVFAEPLDRAGDVVNFEHQAIPATGLRRSSVGHGPGRGGCRAGQPEAQVAESDAGERRQHLLLDFEAQDRDVEVDAARHVGDQVAHRGHQRYSP